jgi:CubicO group peptidase (beta-lactamase class C family)
MKKLKIAVTLTLFFASTFSVQAQLPPRQIDSLVEKTLKAFDVPGIAVAVIKDGKIIHSKGYGVRSLNTKQKVDENTLFGIASNSKAFTAAALGMLVDEGKIKWDDKVIDYVPEFRLYNPYVTEEFTIRDLLTHRSGLGLGAGDLMFWPDSSDFTKKDMIHNLRYLKQVSSFRTKYDYDNNLYIVAGEVLARAAGMTWEDFIQKRILTPLGMSGTAPSFKLLKNNTNVIDPHAAVNGRVKVVRRDWSETANAAGGIYSNLTDMCKWAIMLLNKGKYGKDLNKNLFSNDVQEEMWAPQTIIPVRGASPYNTHFASYGLGWFLRDEKGYKVATHTGGLLGIVTQVTLIPELKLGIMVFTNQQVGAAFSAITNTIKDSYYGIKGNDWVKNFSDRVSKATAEAKTITDKIWKDIAAQQKITSPPDVNNFTGTYNDKWFGDVLISVKNGRMWFDSKRSFLLTGEMFPYKGSTFIVKWNDRSMDADAFVIFNMDDNGKASSIKMKAISPLTDFSFDFHDLDLNRVK